MITRLRQLLTQEGARFEILAHRDAYTAQERAAACHVTGRRVAKVVVVRDDPEEWFALAVLPASANLDMVRLREFTGRPRLRLAREEEFARLFPDCDVGAMPPFSRLYPGLRVFLDRELAEQPELVFVAGTHREEIRMTMSDYLRIERPEVVAVAAQARAA